MPPAVTNAPPGHPQPWASEGETWILVPWYQYLYYDAVDLVVTMLPAEPERFTAKGLSEGGEMSWEYEFRFEGLKECPASVGNGESVLPLRYGENA